MSEPLTQEAFYRAMLEFREDMNETIMSGHSRLREDMNEGFRAVQREQSLAAERAAAVQNRVLVIETERKSEAAEVMRRTTWVSIIVPAAMLGLVEGAKRWFGDHL